MTIACILALPSAYQEYLVTLKIDDVSYGTKSTITQDVLDAFYAVKGLNGQPY